MHAETRGIIRFIAHLANAARGTSQVEEGEKAHRGVLQEENNPQKSFYQLVCLFHPALVMCVRSSGRSYQLLLGAVRELHRVRGICCTVSIDDGATSCPQWGILGPRGLRIREGCSQPARTWVDGGSARDGDEAHPNYAT
jgi:hypothetical protein